MARRTGKDYSAGGGGITPIDIDGYRRAPWRQTWNSMTFDFRRWLYIGRPQLDKEGRGEGLISAGRDPIVEAVRDAVWNINVRETTKVTTCASGLPSFFEFLDYRAETSVAVTELSDIDLSLLKDFIHWLQHIKQADTTTGKLRYTTARGKYVRTKTVLQHLVKLKSLPYGIFPPNPFPNANRSLVSHEPYSKPIMLSLMRALGQDYKRLLDGTLEVFDSEKLTICLLIIAARTGRNIGPLLNLARDSLQPHPIKPAQRALLTTYKPRGNNTSVQGFDDHKMIEDTRSVPIDVVSVFKFVTALSAPLVAEVLPEHRENIWLFRSAKKGDGCRAAVLNYSMLMFSIRNIVERHALKGEDGKPLQVNVSRLRETFAQNIWARTGGDIIKTAHALGNTPQVTDRHYLAVTPEMEANHRRLGHLMYADYSGALDNQEQLKKVAKEIGIPVEQITPILRGDNNTGVGRCRDPRCGAKAPGDGSLCTRWLSCFTCPDQLVFESDLYRLFSFYWLLIKERSLINRKRWEETWAPIVNIIDEEIVQSNLRTPENPKGCFDPYRVEKARQEAKLNPHLSWRDRSILGGAYEDD